MEEYIVKVEKHGIHIPIEKLRYEEGDIVKIERAGLDEALETQLQKEKMIIIH